MSTAKPMRPVDRAWNYIEQEALRCEDSMQRRPLTPAQRRRIKHKNNRMLGAERNATPKQVKNRQIRPAPVAGGLRMLLSPKQVQQRVQARSANRGIKFNIKRDKRPDVMIIDDPIRVDRGDR